MKLVKKLKNCYIGNCLEIKNWKLEIPTAMLSPSAEQLITDYLNLPFPGIPGVRCPYFNNAKLRRRAELRALIGKGTPQEIVEEAKIISLQYHSGLFDKKGNCCLHNEHTGQKMTAEDVRKFLIDRHLGVECSGFVTHVLSKHFWDTNQIKLTKQLKICSRTNLLRKLICRLRPVENCGVAVYATDQNTDVVVGEAAPLNYTSIQAADVIILLNTGPRHNHNHIILITEKNGQTISYVHAREWPSEGLYGHGVARGTITLINPQANLLAQRWEECGKLGAENETFIEATQAKTLEIRRIKLL